MLGLRAGDEVGDAKAEMIVAGGGVQLQHAPGTLAVLGGDTAGLDVDGTKGIGGDTESQLSVGGLGDVETVEQDERLVGFGAGDVGLPVNVVDHLRDVVENVVVVARAGIREIDDVHTTDLFLRVDLFGVDGRGRLHHINDFANLALVRQSEFEIGGLVEAQLGGLGGIEVFFFDAGLVRTRAGDCDHAHSGGAGLAAQGR